MSTVKAAHKTYSFTVVVRGDLVSKRAMRAYIRDALEFARKGLHPDDPLFGPKKIVVKVAPID